MTDNSFPNKNSGKRLNILSNNNTNRINQMDNNDLLEENRRLKTLNVNTKNSLMKLANENKNLKIKLRKLEENNNHIINMQKEVNQLKNLITENNLTNFSSNLTNSNIEYEQKIIFSNIFHFIIIYKIIYFIKIYNKSNFVHYKIYWMKKRL